MDEIKLPPSPAPSFFAYRFQSHYGPVWRSSSETWNGLKPNATTGLHTTKALEDYARAAVEADRVRHACQTLQLTMGDYGVLRAAATAPLLERIAELEAIVAGQIEMYLNLTDAMGYTSGKDGLEFSPEEYANHLRSTLAKAQAAPQPAQSLTDEQIDTATSRARDELLDHIYEYGTASEGIMRLLRKLARAIEQAATAALLARIAELEDELSAIGAGGVGPLMEKENTNAR